MNYYKISITSTPEKSDLIVAFLNDSGLPFNGFEEETFGFKAYVPEKEYEEAVLEELADKLDFTYKKKLIPAQNWNKVWESNFEPIRINNFCGVRADFHPEFQNVTHQITINPKMAFGTGHHETTLAVMEIMQSLDFNDKRVFDYGCGTGILSILASKMGAGIVLALDNDPHSYENTFENCSKNQIDNIKIQLGDLSQVEADDFDIILANINRNVILNSLPSLFLKTKPGGQVLISGFLLSDQELLTNTIENIGFSINKVLKKGEWLCMHLTT